MPLPLIFAMAATAQAGSSLLEGFAAYEDAKLEQRIAERNAAIAEQDARAIELKGQFDQLRAAERAEVIMGGLRADLGASGARLDVGAPIRLLAEQAKELELDIMLMGEETSIRAAKLRSQAQVLRFGGKIARQRGKRERMGGILRAFGSAARSYARGKELFGKSKVTYGGPVSGIIERRDVSVYRMH